MEHSTCPVPVALVTGGSAGLGIAIVQALVDAGYQVVVIGRDPDRFQRALDTLEPSAGGGTQVKFVACDVSDKEAVDQAFAVLQRDWGRLDVLINCVGLSDRGRVEALTAARVEELIAANVLSALHCCQAALPMLRARRGVVINIGSLAAKVGARYLGGYSLAKHALAGLTQQMRLEWREYGVHVALVNPGPIQRADAGKRYAAIAGDIPDSARLPAGGANLRGLPAQRVAKAVMRAIHKRSPDIILPRSMRALVCLGHALPRLGDWLLLRFTSKK